MIVFVKHDGSIALQSVSTINQGSVDANKITIVHPFSTAIVRLAFTLPNGIVLEEPKLASDSTSIPIDEYKGLSVSEYTLDKELTRVAGTLGIQIFFTYIDPTDITEKRTVTIPTPLINITINNGSRFIPDNVVGNDTDIIAIASAAKGSAANAEKSASEAQTSASAAQTSASAAQKSAANATTQASAAQKSAANATTQASNAAESASAAQTSAANAETSAATAVSTANEAKTLANEAKTEVTNSVKITPSDTSIPQTINSGIDVKGDVKAKSITLPAVGKDAIEIVNNGALSIDNSIDVEGDVKAGGNLIVADNAEIGGNLTVKGKTVSQSKESLIINTNIIVTNSSGASFSTSGLVIRIPENENKDNAYGILYDPNADAVMVGIGKLNPNTYEFAYSSGQKFPLAARDGFDGTQNAVVPIWNSEKNAFIPTNAKVKTVTDIGGSQYKCFEIASDVLGAISTRIAGHKIETNSVWANNIYLSGSKVATESFVTGQIGDLEEFLRKVNEGGLV